MSTSNETRPLPRFRPLFAVALAIRLAVVALGVLLIPVQPKEHVVLFGQGIAGFSDELRPKSEINVLIRQQILDGPARVIEPWYRWDACWIVNIAENGYALAEDPAGRLGVAFMPVLPAVLVAADTVGLNSFWAGLIAANLASAAGAAVFARVAAKLTGDRAIAIRTFILLNAFPSALFFSAPYNEGFGLLFTALALSAWLDNKPVRAGVFALLGSLARMTGVALGAAAIAAWLFEDRTRQGAKRALILAAGSFAGLLLFWGYLGWAVGDPLAGLKSQTAWGRKELSAWNPILAIESIYDPQVPHWGEAFAVLGFGVLGIRAWWKRGTFWGVLILAPVGQMMMSGTFLSGHRLILAALPGFIELADVLRSKLLFRLTVCGFVLMQFVLINRYVHWVWAG